METQNETNPKKSNYKLDFNVLLKKEFDPKREDYRMVISDAWKDMHHSRVQEWSSLGVVSAMHVAIIQLLNFISKNNTGGNQNLTSYSYIIFFAGIIGIFFALIGIGLTYRHRKILITKLNWITIAQYKLGLMIDITKTFSDSVNEKGVIPLEQTMIDKIKLYEKEINKEKGKRKYSFGINSIRRWSTSSLMIAFYFALILLDCFLIFYFIAN
jgi:hypothetical protein